ncbi:COP9 signalosome complex subunit 4 [Symbiodinium microadriaticum]|uniref:COP9 signalosome complex subunit 4 n=1 Tax=Symbiodinium microadriaticum TaxID=2951 RepID=A0A1Q9E1S7_SYMMI|nr:COP9 signalosome complex subunit 4 [Symbiodinium microadriaticum]
MFQRAGRFNQPISAWNYNGDYSILPIAGACRLHKGTAVMPSNGIFQVMSGIVGATPDATGRMEKFTELVKSLVEQHDVQQLKDLVDGMLAEESSFALFARPVLQQVAEQMDKLKNTELKELALHTLDRLRGRVVSFEEEDFVIRELLSEVFQAEGDWAEAAKCLAAINLESGTRCRTPLQKAEKYVKIAELYLEDDDPISADTFCSRAAMVMHEVNDTPLLLRYRVCHARVLDSKRYQQPWSGRPYDATCRWLHADDGLWDARNDAGNDARYDAWYANDGRHACSNAGLQIGKGRGKRAPNAEHCLPTIHPEVEALCKKFNIEDKIVRRLDDVMRTREDSFEEDLKALYEVCETAKKPSGSLMVKIGELERGCFTGAGKLDQCMLTFRSKYKLDDRAHARFVEVCHPRAQKLDDIKRLEKYLKGNQNPSQAILPLLTRIEKDGRLDSPERNKDKDRDRPGITLWRPPPQPLALPVAKEERQISIQVSEEGAVEIQIAIEILTLKKKGRRFNERSAFHWKFLEAASKYCDLSQQTFGGQICEVKVKAAKVNLREVLMQREVARLRRLGMGINRGQAPLAIEDGQPDTAGATTEDDLKEARVDKLVAEHLSSQFRYKPLVAAHMNHILACKKCCGTSKFGTRNGACSRAGRSLSFTKDTGREFRDKFAENYDKAKALEQAKVQGAKRARATVSKERLIRGSEVQKFEDSLLPHQKATGGDGATVLERAVLQHNVLAASRVSNQVTPERAEKIAAKMIAESRLAGFIDQKSGIIHFEGIEGVESVEAMGGEQDESLIEGSVGHEGWLRQSDELVGLAAQYDTRPQAVAR